jgi:hypothetical protein
MLVVNPAFYLYSCILPRDPQGRFRSNKLVNSCFPCEPFGNFISAYPSMSMDPKQSHRMLDGNVVQRLFSTVVPMGTLFWNTEELPKPSIRTNTNIFLWSSVHLNFVSIDQNSIGLYFGSENCSLFSERATEPSSYRLPIDPGPGPTGVLDPSVYQTSPLTAGGVPGPLFCSQSRG